MTREREVRAFISVSKTLYWEYPVKQWSGYHCCTRHTMAQYGSLTHLVGQAGPAEDKDPEYSLQAATRLKM